MCLLRLKGVWSIELLVVLYVLSFLWIVFERINERWWVWHLYYSSCIHDLKQRNYVHAFVCFCTSSFEHTLVYWKQFFYFCWIITEVIYPHSFQVFSTVETFFTRQSLSKKHCCASSVCVWSEGQWVGYLHISKFLCKSCVPSRNCLTLVVRMLPSYKNIMKLT